MIRRLLVLACALLQIGCTTPAPAPVDRSVLISIGNAGSEPLECRVIFGHWVERDLGVLAKGSGGIEVKVKQQKNDGALFVMRDDGQRRMMIENIFCARKGDWRATVGQIDLAVVRVARPAVVRVSCALPEDGGRVVCGKPYLMDHHL
jgi:hypothetical protein